MIKEAKLILMKQQLLKVIDFEGEVVAVLRPENITYYTKHYVAGKLYGINLYAVVNNKEVLLETYESERTCKHVKSKIKKAIRRGKKAYQIPAE